MLADLQLYAYYLSERNNVTDWEKKTAFHLQNYRLLCQVTLSDAKEAISEQIWKGPSGINLILLFFLCYQKLFHQKFM